MERITFLVGRCTIYEKLYLTEHEGVKGLKASDPAKTATEELRKALIILYTTILRALGLCIKVFNGMLTIRPEIEWALTSSPGNILGKLRSPDATFAEITALDAPEAGVYSAVQTLENCCKYLTQDLYVR